MYRCYTPDVAGVWHPQVHKACAHNMASALLQRTMGPTPVATPAGRQMFLRSMRQLRRVLKGRCELVEPWGFDQVVASYKERRLRVRYQEAHDSLLRDGFCTPRDARVKAFVKGEKLANYKVYKPRAIMGRDPRYNLELASFLKPVEHVVYPAFRGWGKQFFTHTRLIGKGLNQVERAALIRRKLQSHPGVVAFEVDCKSFESHVDLAQLRAEHSVYTALCRDPRLGELLRWQQRFSGVGTGGVKFTVEGVRASGDFNTGLGNTLIMCCLVLAAATSLGVRFDLLADGDNAVLFCLKRDLTLFRKRVPAMFLEMGHELELSETFESVEQVVFGQSKPCWVDGVWTMVRDPFKVLSHAWCGHEHFSEMRGGKRVLRAIAYCEAVLSRGVPMLQEYSHAMLRATRGMDVPLHIRFTGNPEYQRVLARGIRWESARKLTVSTQTRLSFEKSWGVSVGEQIRLERLLAAVPSLPDGWGDVPPDEGLPDGRMLLDMPFGSIEARWQEQRA